MNTIRGAIVALLFVVCGGTSVAKDPDPRFEGIWNGVETYLVEATPAQWGSPPIQKPAVLAIGDSGRILAVVQGLYPGRYKVLTDWVSNRREPPPDNALVFAMSELPHTRLYRRHCQLVLSRDGNTITEKGSAYLPRDRYPVVCDIIGTFHKQSLSQKSSWK